MEEDYKKMEEEWEKLKGKNEKERSEIIDELFIKRFPQLQEGFFKYKGRIFKLGEGVKKTWLGKSFWFQGYVFDESIKDWSPVEYNTFMEAVKNGVNIKELPEEIKKHKTK